MSIRHSSRSSAVPQWTTALGVLLLTLVIGSPAAAATFTWTGAGGNPLWTTNANWQGNVTPTSSIGPHTLVFPAGAVQTTMLNDAVGLTVVALRFDAPYTLTGNSLTIKDGVDVTFTGAGTVTMDLAIVLATPQLLGGVTFDTSATLQVSGIVSGASSATLRKAGAGTLLLASGNTYQGSTIVAAGTLDIGHVLSLGAHTASTTVLNGATLRVSGSNGSIPEPLMLAGQGATGDGSALFFTGNNNEVSGVTLGTTDAAIAVAASRTARVTGAISGSVGLHTRGAGTLTLAGAANLYDGLTTVHGGTLVLQKNNAVAVPNGLSIENGTVRLMASNAIQGSVAIGAFGSLNLNDQSDNIAVLSGSGELLLGSGQLTITGDTPNATFSGPISGTGVLKKVGDATLTLTGASAAFTGQLENVGGILEVNGLTGADAQIQGTMRGQGTVDALTMVNGILVPGGPLFSTLHSSAVTLNASSALRINSTGSTTGDTYTQLRVTGLVTLGNAVLTISDDKVVLQELREVVIIDNDGTDAIGGTFLNLPEGAMVTGLFGHRYRLSYSGGSGNDVSLQPLPEYHLSEGATGAFFDTDLLIANPGEEAAPIEVRFLKPGGDTVTQTYTVPGMSRLTIRVDDVPGLEATEVSTIVTSTDGRPIVVERTMRWNETGYGAHTEKAVAGPSKTWYFAEGSQGFFYTYLLLANPRATSNTATVEYLREGLTSVTRSYPLAPNSRKTIDLGEDVQLVNQSFGMIVTFDEPGVAERAMYFGLDPLWKAGHESAGVQALSNSWFLAEGATGAFFETFVLLANPGDAAADVTVTFLPESGAPVVKTKTVPARGRLTINVEAEEQSLQNSAVATRVESTQPIVVERAQYWPDPAPRWYEAHNSFGVTAPASSWGLAEGRVGGSDDYQTYILLANPGSAAAAVKMVFLREGQTPITKLFTVPPTSRFTVSTGPGSLVPELQNERFGVLIESAEPIVVERAMYANAGGPTWSAGTNATATRLPAQQP
jgi:autotransporter-associated beta strand protein